MCVCVCMYVRVCVCTCVCVCVCVFVCLKKFSEIIPVFSVSIDMHLGTPVFGYCDSKSGKFHPKANFSFTVTSYCNGDRFSFPSWQLEVKDRKKVSFVLIPEYMEKNKEITNHISSVLKRSFFLSIPDKKFREYFRAQLIHHINTKDIKRLIISYTGKDVMKLVTKNAIREF